MQRIPCFDHFGHKYSFDETQYIDRKAVYGIFLSANKILLVKDAKSSNWEIPGGGKKNRESDRKCLKREFYEETGLTVQKELIKYTDSISYFYDVTSKQPWKTSKKYYFIQAQLKNLKINGNNNDIIEARFFSFEQFDHISVRKETMLMLKDIWDYHGALLK